MTVNGFMGHFLGADLHTNLRLRSAQQVNGAKVHRFNKASAHADDRPSAELTPASLAGKGMAKMPLLALPYPVINPVLVNIGPFPIRWYALAYVAGLALGWATARFLVGRDRFWRPGQARPSVLSIDDLVVYIAVGIIAGGRLGYVLFYNLPFFVENPLEIPKLWTGGMSFHGGLVGAVLGFTIFAWRHRVPVLTVGDVVAAGVPFGLLFGRLANFIKPELWGRMALDVTWAMVFPGGGPLPRHPSQLYEAALEGVVLLLILALAIRRNALHRPGLVCGLFAIGYGIARIIVEFFREPDPQLGFLFGGATMGMLLSVPLVLAGIALVFHARRQFAENAKPMP